MEFEQLRAYLMAKAGATEEQPFGPDVLVYKVMGKIFALLFWREEPLRLNLKCDPLEALALRQQYAAVLPGYHMNKRHWNTLVLDGTLPEAEVWGQIDQSYALVVQGLTRAQRRQL
ncbi:MmcQ/YjbR family DNA-binding protein [Litorilinea aerophila]|uniref:MmcQ/YjbR family DNA-binding protein n=1 Tax=Litorilinea aerophila TaxID=1204385 RepID=A0A540VCJ5_9CHLR|nr:MmcQ/YjbR family DNA-binding protein [Litorilinea aerophila]MCC9077702.1 MmcQ/YjbR family DNA-binding protein [Litorilinea aerophila]OUC07231.1 MmcQ-like protein [Litorilinea aerophila]GIV77016.1 MAG: hypothetical protein KatS3mg050_1410 [Litorilinea sp.]